MPERSLKKGDTLWEIGRDLHIHWETIWNAEENRHLRQKYKAPENIQANDDEKWFIPVPEGLKTQVLSNQKSICTIRRPKATSEIPRFDCHCHAHADSVFRMWTIACITPSEAEKAMICRTEPANFASVSNPGGQHGRVAVVPLLLDMAYCPLWNESSLDSSIDAGIVAMFSASIGRTTKEKSDELTDWDVLNIYPPGDYIVCDDDFDRWRDAIVAVHRSNPGYCFPFVPFDPRRPDAIGRVKDCIVNWGFVGIKFYTRMGWRLTGNSELVGSPEIGRRLDSRVGEMLAWAEENDVPILNHCTPGGWPPDEHIAFPNGFHDLHAAENGLRQFQSRWREDIGAQIPALESINCHGLRPLRECVLRSLVH